LLINNYTIEKGILEVWPFLNQSGELSESCFRLPFQEGFAPLDDELLISRRYADAEEREKRLHWYFQNKYTDPYDIDISSLNDLPAFGVEHFKFGRKEFEEGKAYWEGQKLSHQGERTGALKRILYYLAEHDPDSFGYGFEEERFETAWGWLQENHNGVSDTWNNEGAKKCKQELKHDVFKRFEDNEKAAIARAVIRQGKLNQKAALVRIDKIVSFLLDTEGQRGISSDGSSVNISRLFSRIRGLRNIARSDSSFEIFGLTNEQIQTGVNRKTLDKHRDRIHHIWMEWEANLP
jgi:hypothetical protein